MLGPILLLVAVSFVLGVPLAIAARSLGRRLNALDAPGVKGQVKASPRRVPNTGGIAIFWSVALPLGAALVAKGESIIDNAQVIERTFAGVLGKLKALGAQIEIEP